MPMFQSLQSKLSLACLLVLAIAVGSLSAASYASFPGSKALVLLFSTLSVLSVAASWLLNRSSYVFLLCAFLFLGLWAKFAAHFAFGVSFIEPTGQFDDSPEAWNTVLSVASAGLAGVIAGTLAAHWLTPNYTLPAVPFRSRLVSRFGIYLLGIGGAVAFLLYIFNFRFAILKMGYVPRIDLHPYYSVAVGFVVSWGALVGLLAVTFWLVAARRLPATAIFYVASLEGALAALSMGSRVQMILHVIAATIVYLNGRALGWRITIKGWIKVVALTAVLFVVSLLGVSLDRAVSFASASPAPEDAISAEQVPEPNSQADLPETVAEEQSPVQGPQDLPPPAPSNAAQEASITHRISLIPYEISRLFVMRWVGLEGILSAVGSPHQLGPELLLDSVREMPSAGIDAIYQRMAASTYERFSNFVFMTLPGPVAVSFFGGSLLLCFAMMFGFAFTGAILEAVAYAATRNIAVSAVIGVSLAYLVVQLNFPRTLFFFVIEMAGAVTVLSALALLLTLDRRMTESRSRSGVEEAVPAQEGRTAVDRPVEAI